MDEKIEYNPAWGICKPIRNNDEYEIAKIICKTTHKTELKHCEIMCNVDCINYGKAIKEAGYRKESDTAREIFERIFEVLGCFTTQGKSREYTEGFVDCLEEVDKRLQNLAEEKYGVDLGE